MKKPVNVPSFVELLAPAGDWEALSAACANGADAVYFGLSSFNARMRAANFSPGELPEIVAYLHGRNVKGYVAMNTLVFAGELSAAADLLRAAAGAGVDAVIVQDVGLAELAHRMLPALPLHASTQMTVTSPGGVALAREIGISRVILARELSLDEIRRVVREGGAEAEVFVHGALCVSYSGQCLASLEMLGRSANRGQCAQVCRLPYALVVDGREQDAGDRPYLLSPRDLAAHSFVGDLAAAGVAALKIEGRMKSAAYVAGVTRVYREALDAAAAGLPFTLSAERERELELAFSRGFTHAYLSGEGLRDLVEGRSPTKRGMRVGAVKAKTARGVIIALDAGSAGVKPGDGLVFEAAGPRGYDQGGRVLSVRETGPRTADASFRREDVDLASVPIGCAVYKTDDPAVRKNLQSTFARERPARRVPLHFRVRAKAGEPLRIVARDGDGNETELESGAPLVLARKHPVGLDLLREQLGRLGNTPFELGEIDLADADPVMIPKSLLNDLRQRAVAVLVEMRERRLRRLPAEPDALAAIRREIKARYEEKEPDEPARLCVLVRTGDQWKGALAWRKSEGRDAPAPVVDFDFPETRRLSERISEARSAGFIPGVATPRITRPSETRFVASLAGIGASEILVRNLGALAILRGLGADVRLIGDASLNAANEIAADRFLRFGLDRISPAWDIDPPQLLRMLEFFPARRVEALLHFHAPMFHTQHCVFAAWANVDPDPKPCGRVCRAHAFDLRDRNGERHPVLPDAFCRNTVFGARAKSAKGQIPKLLEAGVRRFRVELLRENAEETKRLLTACCEALKNR